MEPHVSLTSLAYGRAANDSTPTRRPWRSAMRKIIESTLVSLDGVFGEPHTWATEYFDQEAQGYALELLSAADAMLMGRRTYEFFAAAFPHQTGEYGARINSIQKYVFSNTLNKS